jgi:hypothetical protein
VFDKILKKIKIDMSDTFSRFVNTKEFQSFQTISTNKENGDKALNKKKNRLSFRIEKSLNSLLKKEEKDVVTIDSNKDENKLEKPEKEVKKQRKSFFQKPSKEETKPLHKISSDNIIYKNNLDSSSIIEDKEKMLTFTSSERQLKKNSIKKNFLSILNLKKN